MRSQRRAYNLLANQPWYRRQAFDAGLRSVGFEICEGVPQGAEGDVLLIWNRYWARHEIALGFEAGGGTVIVAENGYLGRGGTSPKFDVHPHGPQAHHYYALGLGWHNGRGVTPQGTEKRFPALEVELKPWRAGGEHILVCPNRSFGVGAQVMPEAWAERAAEQLRRITRRPVVVRAHPGGSAPERPITEDLKNAHAVVIWSSSCGVHALVEGIPVVCMAPFWICKGATYDGLPFVLAEHPEADLDREAALERMAWAQWTVEEITSGEAFREVLSAARQDEVAAPA